MGDGCGGITGDIALVGIHDEIGYLIDLSLCGKDVLLVWDGVSRRIN